MKKVLPRMWLYLDETQWNNAPNQSQPGRLGYQNVIALRHGVTI